MQRLRRFCRLLALPGSLCLVLLGLAGPPPAQAQGLQQRLAPTPLILKDGRIARVSVHVLPFLEGGSILASSIAERLAGVVGEAATDCFLTAQVIGHVGAGEIGGGDTLGAHRLARARADTVQSSLIDGGLPANSIASVWDWQFMVREPRATLWIFQLTEGEDCTGDRLAGAPTVAAREVPRNPSPAPPPVEAERTQAQSAVPAGPAPRATTVPEVTRPLPAALREATTPADSAPPRTTARQEPQSPARTAPRPTADPRASEPVRQAARPAPDADALSITFATNSSYFPPGAREHLEALVAKLEPDRRYRLEVVIAVSASEEVVGAESAEDAQRYNRWLAGRRLERVQDWFDERLGRGRLEIEPQFVDDDNSRRVTLRLAPAG